MLPSFKFLSSLMDVWFNDNTRPYGHDSITAWTKKKLKQTIVSVPYVSQNYRCSTLYSLNVTWGFRPAK